ncbi:MAG: phenylalanine--tRNA ligase subunit alpha, partial [Pseudomonadota bacterium]|nr:phenylalanine--tRNA ligase subunit alpha [Pseudomonadota bacterium]
MQEQLEQLIKDAEQGINAAGDLQALDQVRVQYLGKKGLITDQMKSLGKLPPEEKPKAGQAINKAKQQIQQAIEARKAQLQQA